MGNAQPAIVDRESLSPVDPRVRLLLIAVRRALLVLADALAVYCEVPEKGVR